MLTKSFITAIFAASSFATQVQDTTKEYDLPASSISAGSKVTLNTKTGEIVITPTGQAQLSITCPDLAVQAWLHMPQDGRDVISQYSSSPQKLGELKSWFQALMIINDDCKATDLELNASIYKHGKDSLNGLIQMIDNHLPK